MRKPTLAVYYFGKSFTNWILLFYKVELVNKETQAKCLLLPTWERGDGLKKSSKFFSASKERIFSFQPQITFVSSQHSRRLDKKRKNYRILEFFVVVRHLNSNQINKW
jgi:hypothetical protein